MQYKNSPSSEGIIFRIKILILSLKRYFFKGKFNMSEKNYTAEEKVKIVLEALKGTLTLKEMSSKYQVHSSQINRWKNLAKESLVSGFKDKKNKKELENEELVEKLSKQIDQLKVEIEWLKKI